MEPGSDQEQNGGRTSPEREKSFSSRVLSNFTKESKAPADRKLIKRFRHAKKIPSSDEVVRYTPALDTGLTQEQVDERMKLFLFNDVNKTYSKTYASIFFGNIFTFFNLLCVLVALALIYAGAPITQFLFAAIFAVNLLIGIVQELIAKRQIDKLAVLISSSVKVMRGGSKVEIPVKQIVLDDVILLETGQQVPADCILADGNVEVNESLLTGEAEPVKKQKGDMLYAGSFIASGNCRVRAEKVGGATYLYSLTSKAKKYRKPQSEIMNSIRLFIRVIGGLILVISVLMAWRNWEAITADMVASGGIDSWKRISQTIQLTCAVIVGMIPSGLLLLTSLAIEVGRERLARKHTLVQDSSSLEMLARVNVLCLDKTGTLTDGRMTVNDCMLLGGFEDHSLDEIMSSLLAATGDNNQTAIALGERFGHSGPLRAVTALPFSSKTKLSAATFADAGTYVLGAPEFVLRPVPLRIEKIVRQYAQTGLRVLVLAYSSAPISEQRIPSNLRAVAVITLADNVREDAIPTVKWFRENDVDIKIISGDNPMTVSEVARRVGVRHADKFISLEGLTDLEVENVATEYTVFGRVTPEQKAILIKTIKKQGNTVAMTGDGVNDILALKEADFAISVASGAEAARNVSHLVLMDNNFGNLPTVVYEGRRVINNIKSCASLYLMKTLLITVLAIICVAMGTRYFFTTNNMLLFEVFVAAFPSFVISLQPNGDRVKGKFIPYVLSRSIPGAVTLVGCIMAVYAASSLLPAEYGFSDITLHALYMLALTFGGLVMLFRILQPFNILRFCVYLFSLGLCVLVLAVPSFGNIVFTDWDTVSFTFTQILYICCVVLAAFPVSNILVKLCDLMNPTE